ncbi:MULTISPECIES: UxaA family hydrolase [unclassified Variovorax]|uniref:UxaA family hydrolase n=1 Tax=unclassified Variovorax TaxID=663243 RepID=UPI0013172408|nr:MULTISPECIES: UxaA family hydrolase [unclassified Variovorax]VTU12981.1 (2R)-sulfolactate sulfo-lyase subunit beta [Variovorax sp. SRS16]VTU16767.1 (2R)-sulfolactate sulfo-lyase subunit beta [Variovorax sp. PBL-E5]
MTHTFWGYRRPDGRVGIRNHVAILAVMDNANGVVRHLAQLVRGTLPLPVWYGRGQFGADDELFRGTQVGLASNPNIAAVLVVSLEQVSARKVAEAIAASGKPVESISIQDVGGTVEAIAKGMRILASMVQNATAQRPERCPLSALTLGVECGGTDTTSGLASNPALGWVADQVVDAGGVVYLSETSEWMGAETVLARRARDESVAKSIFAAVKRIEDDAHARGVDIRGANPVPDNIRGGISSIEEKSLGAIIKGGTGTIQDVLPYGQRASGKGLYLMDTPAPAAESMTGLAAGGAQLIVFTTGQMNIMGCPIAPTIKITGNPRTAQRLADNVDVDVSSLLAGEALETVGAQLLECLLQTASGRLTRAEIFGDEEIAISRIQPTV